MKFGSHQKKMARVVLQYHGGKFKIADWIVGFFPAHEIYVEAYAGAASVLMRKQRSHGEVYNDIDDEIGNVFRVLRDRESAAELEMALCKTILS